MPRTTTQRKVRSAVQTCRHVVQAAQEIGKELSRDGNGVPLRAVENDDSLVISIESAIRQRSNGT